MSLGMGACEGTSPTEPCGAKNRKDGNGFPTAPAWPTPGPGADIDPRVLLEAEAPLLPSREAQASLPTDLGSDRPLLPVAVPRVPRAATASFTFASGHRGWVTRLPQPGPLPSVAVGEGRIFASGGFNTIAVYALASDSGQMLWHRQDLEDNGPTAPLYDDGELIFNTESCTLFVLDARTGRTRWKRWLGDPTLAQPALHDGRIYAAYPEGGSQKLGAFALRSGRLLWSRDIGSELLTAPIVEGGDVYAATLKGRLFRFQGRTGRPRWQRALAATSAPVIEGSRLYISRALSRGGQRHEGLAALDVETGRPLTLLREAPARYLSDVPRTLDNWPQVWAFEGSRPLVFGGRLLDTLSGAITASDPLTGKTLWQRRSATPGQRAFTAPVLAGSQLVAASPSGAVYALDVDTGMTVWAYRLDRAISASPVVARGWIYLSTTDGAIVALEVGDSAGLDGWPMWGGGPGHNGNTRS